MCWFSLLRERTEPFIYEAPDRECGGNTSGGIHMAEVIIYATQMCPYCHAAKRLLRSKGVEFTEIDVTFDPEGRRRMTEKANGRHTVPQIFINGRHIGGYDDMAALDKAGRLDPLLAEEG